MVSLPQLEPMPERLVARVLLSVGDDVSTDEILPAGSRVLPYRSNIPKIAEFAFIDVAPGYVAAARDLEDQPHAIVAGYNYGQGSSREHAALAPRVLGLRLVIARSFARIHRQNLINYGVLPLTLDDDGDDDDAPSSGIGSGDDGTVLVIDGLPDQLRQGDERVVVQVDRPGGDGAAEEIRARHDLSPRQVEVVLAGGRIPHHRQAGVADTDEPAAASR